MSTGTHEEDFPQSEFGPKPTPTASLTTAAEDDLAHDIASDWFATLSSTTAYGVLTVAERRDLKDTIAKGLTTYAAQVRPQWQDIATAPKDGTELLLFNGFRFIGRYFTPQFQTGGWWVSNAMPVTPTHWQPLPSPPGSPSSQTDTGDK